MSDQEVVPKGSEDSEPGTPEAPGAGLRVKPGSALEALKKKYEAASQGEAVRVGGSRRWVRWVRPLGYLALAVLILWGVQPYTTYTLPPDASHMAPKYGPGVRVLVHTGFRTPERLHYGDGVVYDLEWKGKSFRLMGRVVGMPGDEVQVAEGRLLLNGEPAIEEYLSGAPVGRARSSRSVDTVPPGGLYLLNDARGSPILDSRDFGPLPAGQVVGKVIAPFGGE